MKSLLITGGRILDPSQGLDEEGSLLIINGRISWLGIGDAAAPESSDGYDVLEAPGMVVCPGFIDLHCHLREPGFEHKETIATGTRAAARGGFTTVCCMPNTNPPVDTPTVIDYIQKKAREEGVVRVLPIACVTGGRRGLRVAPLRGLAAAGAVGFSDDGDPVRDDEIMRQALITGKQLGLPVIDHCEDPVGGPPEGEAKIVARDIKLANETGGWVHIAHISTAGSVGLVRRAKGAGIPVTCEVTPHHLTLTAEEIIRYGADAKVNPPLRTKKDLHALILGLHDDVIDIIATDHAPHTPDEKHAGMASAPSGISGFETALGSLMTLVHGGKITLSKLVSKLTAEPARILGGRYDRSGTLAVGAPADITIIDPDREWIVDPDEFASKGKNTPLSGVVLRGKVVATIVAGKVVHNEKL
ncbi:MAG: hypothetical protein A2147_10840 [Chloroflexi bacterium RBG_16_57_8]|nr:MAG: hypothetical protein A2147_10840 [Chloroflexi bacterium RBG_16_57_8]